MKMEKITISQLQLVLFVQRDYNMQYSEKSLT